MQNQLLIDAQQRLDEWTNLCQAPTSAPGVWKPSGTVFRGMQDEESAKAYAEQAAAYFRSHALEKPVFVVHGPTSTTKCKFEVVTETCGYSVVYRTSQGVPDCA